MKKPTAVTPEAFIAAIRSSFIGSEQVYTQGSCIAFFRILKLIFPQAVAYWSYEMEHMIAEIGNAFYDITGEIPVAVVNAGKYERVTCEYKRMSLAVALTKKTVMHSFTAPYQPNP